MPPLRLAVALQAFTLCLISKYASAEVFTIDPTAGGPSSVAALASRTPGVTYLVERRLRGALSGSVLFATSPFPTGESNEWTTIPITPPTVLVETPPSLAVVSGFPMIAWFDAHNEDLMISVSSSTNGSREDDWQSTLVYGIGDVGSEPSLHDINGHPAISHHYASQANLLYSRSVTPDGLGEWQTVTVAHVDIVGRFSSLALVDGRPAISYIAAITTDLSFAFSETATGLSSGDWFSIVVDSVSEVRGLCCTTLSVVGLAEESRPAIAYFTSTGDLRYAVSRTRDGQTASEWEIVVLEVTGRIPRAATLSVTISGYPVIVYSADEAGGVVLEVMTSSTPHGISRTDWSSVASIPTDSNSVSSHLSMAAVGANVFGISFYDSESSQQRYTTVEVFQPDPRPDGCLVNPLTVESCSVFPAVRAHSGVTVISEKSKRWTIGKEAREFTMFGMKGDQSGFSIIIEYTLPSPHTSIVITDAALRFYNRSLSNPSFNSSYPYDWCPRAEGCWSLDTSAPGGFPRAERTWIRRKPEDGDMLNAMPDINFEAHQVCSATPGRDDLGRPFRDFPVSVDALAFGSTQQLRIVFLGEGADPAVINGGKRTVERYWHPDETTDETLWPTLRFGCAPHDEL